MNKALIIMCLSLSSFPTVISESAASDIEKIKLMVDLNAEKLKKLEKPKKKKMKVKKETGTEEVVTEKKKRKPRKKKEKECLVMMDEDGEEDDDDNCAAIKCLKPTGQCGHLGGLGIVILQRIFFTLILLRSDSANHLVH